MYADHADTASDIITDIIQQLPLFQYIIKKLEGGHLPLRTSTSVSLTD